MAVALRTTMHSEVFRRGDDTRMQGIGPLQTVDEVQAKLTGEERIFAVSLLAAAPPRVAEDIDVRRPNCESEINTVDVVPDGFVVLRARFGGDDLTHGLQQRGIPRCRHADGLREERGVTGARYAVQAFVPVVVSRHVESGNGRCSIDALRPLLFERHARDEVVRTLFG